MNLQTAILAYGTSEGASRAWDSRGRGRHPQEHGIRTHDRSERAKESHVPVTSEKVRLAKESVVMLSKALGADPTPDNHPFDILLHGTKVGIEVKRFFPGHKNPKVTIHSGQSGKGEGASRNGSKDKKVAFAKETGMKRLYVAVHDTSDPNHERWYARRLGDKGDPWADPKDPNTGWSYRIKNMASADSISKLVRLLK